jgi:hypothetical protein
MYYLELAMSNDMSYVPSSLKHNVPNRFMNVLYTCRINVCIFDFCTLMFSHSTVNGQRWIILCTRASNTLALTQYHSLHTARCTVTEHRGCRHSDLINHNAEQLTFYD